jgi:hypothetical protein
MNGDFVALSLKETRFWLRIMKEHLLFLKLGFTVNDTELVKEADRLYSVFAKLEEQANAFPVASDATQIRNFNSAVAERVAEVWSFKRKVLGLALTCQIRGNNYPLLIDHVSREAAYFYNRLMQLNAGQLDPLPDAIINENCFFLRIMADHAKFITHLLDPSERKFIDMAREFKHDFDQLLFQAQDLESMSPQSQTKPLLSQFLDQNRVSVASLRDFKKTSRDLIAACKIKSNIHPLLADHTLREAEWFLNIIDSFERQLLTQQ